MLKYLEVTNFKAWHRLQIPFGKVTGLFGENSSGKSSVLQFLLLLKQTKNATDRGLVLDFGGPDELVNLGNYQDLVHKGDATATIDWALDWSLQNPLRISDPMSRRAAVLMEGDRIRVDCGVSLKGSSLAARYLKYRFADTDVSIEPKSEGAAGFNLKKDNQAFTRNQGRGWACRARSRLISSQIRHVHTTRTRAS